MKTLRAVMASLPEKEELIDARALELAAGMVHKVPTDLRKALTSDPKALAAWKDITPLARNEWICWIESAKKLETRNRRLERASTDLKDGKRRPCCWPGCPHR
jgi:uncharacterized protein YdeI (YjbR/CyaY-like superfamily)